MTGARTRIPVSAAPPLPAPRCDCSRCDFFIGNPSAREPVCSGSNSDCDYCGCARAEQGAALHDSGCRECSIRCGSRVDIDAWMIDIGSTVKFDDLDLAELELTDDLPAYIPQVDSKDLVSLDAGLSWPAYAIGLRRVISDATYAMLPGFAGRTARESLGLRDDQACVLVGYGKDPLVEALWTRSRPGSRRCQTSTRCVSRTSNGSSRGSSCTGRRRSPATSRPSGPIATSTSCCFQGLHTWRRFSPNRPDS